MNEHLIKKLRISVLLNFLVSIVVVGVFCYLIKDNEWYTGFYYLIQPTYLTFTGRKILLEIDEDSGSINIGSYSVLTGKRTFTIDINEIIELDFFRGFVVKYKNSKGKTTETFEINAEPWNTIYGQIKQLKLNFQDIEKQRKLALNLESTK